MPPTEVPESDDTARAGDERVSLDLESTGKYLDLIKKAHADTRNKIALVFTYALVLSLPVYFLAKTFGRGMDDLDKIFDRWFSVIGPLAGAAIGAYGASATKH
jgi:hypothetical protein